jgi:hypothetical protein
VFTPYTILVISASNERVGEAFAALAKCLAHKYELARGEEFSIL